MILGGGCAMDSTIVVAGLEAIIGGPGLVGALPNRSNTLGGPAITEGGADRSDPGSLTMTRGGPARLPSTLGGPFTFSWLKAATVGGGARSVELALPNLDCGGTDGRLWTCC